MLAGCVYFQAWPFPKEVAIQLQNQVHLLEHLEEKGISVRKQDAVNTSGAATLCALWEQIWMQEIIIKSAAISAQELPSRLVHVVP